jgi:hypothetical protein
VSRWGTQKPPLGARIDWSHPWAESLAHYWLFNEAAGCAVDLVTGAVAAMVNGPAWSTNARGATVDLTAAATQYVDFGDLSVLDGATQFTILLRGQRKTSGSEFSVTKGPSTSSRIYLGTYIDSTVFFIVADGGISYRQVADGSTSERTWAMRFAGGDAADARLRGWLDGVEQNLVGTGFGTTPTAAPSTANTLRLGHHEAGSTYSNGYGEVLAIWSTARPADQIEGLSRDPYAVIVAPADPLDVVPGLLAGPASIALDRIDAPIEVIDLSLEVAASEIALDRIDAPVEVIPVALAASGTAFVLFEDPTPEPGAELVSGPDLFSVEARPSDDLDPIVTVRAYVAGSLVAHSLVALSSGYRVEAPYPNNDATVYTARVEVETVSTPGDPTSFEWSWSTDRAAPGYGVANGAVSIEPVEYGLLRGGVSMFGGSEMPVEGFVQFVREEYGPLAGGITPALDLFGSTSYAILHGWVTEYVAYLALLGMAEVGEPAYLLALAAIDSGADEGAAAGGLVATLDLEAETATPGLAGMVDVRRYEAQRHDAVVEAGEPVEARHEAAADLRGREAAGAIVLRSPSTSWVDAEDEGD